MADCDHSQPWLATHLPNGHVVYAFPSLNETDKDLVERWHDVIHLLVAKSLGLPASGALLRASGQADAVTDDQLAYEEAAVLAISEYLRSRGHGGS